MLSSKIYFRYDKSHPLSRVAFFLMCYRNNNPLANAGGLLFMIAAYTAVGLRHTAATNMHQLTGYHGHYSIKENNTSTK